MPQAVSFWTGIWEPTREALSKETDILRRALCPGASVVSFSAGQRSSWPSGRVVRLSGGRWMLLRALAATLEPRASVTHVFGEMNAWHLLRAVGRRPIVFTVAIEGPALDRRLYDKVRIFVPETEALAAHLEASGISSDRIRLIYPGVDLDRFRPSSDRDDAFTVLFASSPARTSDFEKRGLTLLVEAARRCPEIRFLLLWREWTGAAEIDRALETLGRSENITVVRRDVADMSQIYQKVHATILLYAQGYGKSCPNSVIEGLACGCPTVVSDSCGIASVVTRSGAGIAVNRAADPVVAALRELRDSWQERSVAARALAERQFSVTSFLESYRSLYAELS